jgi:hypothetical protein
MNIQKKYDDNPRGTQYASLIYLKKKDLRLRSKIYRYYLYNRAGKALGQNKKEICKVLNISRIKLNLAILIVRIRRFVARK